MEFVGDSFVMVEWTDPGDHPGRPIAGPHVHREDDEAWYVLEGRLGFRIGDEEREVAAGEAIGVRHGTPHSYWNAQAAPARYLLVMAPRIHRLIEALHRGDRSDEAAIFEDHGSDLLASAAGSGDGALQRPVERQELGRRYRPAVQVPLAEAAVVRE